MGLCEEADGAISVVTHVYRVLHRNGRLLESPRDAEYTLKVRGVFAQGWRSPGRRRVQKLILFVIYFKIIFL
jgi:hypothetical protein